MSDCITRWFGGLTCDHIYEDCPNRKRVTDDVGRRWIDIAGDWLDPHGTDVCGLCLHRHNRTAHPTAPPELDATTAECLPAEKETR